jgi:hypothetical protein
MQISIKKSSQKFCKLYFAFDKLILGDNNTEQHGNEHGKSHASNYYSSSHLALTLSLQLLLAALTN